MQEKINLHINSTLFSPPDNVQTVQVCNECELLIFFYNCVLMFVDNLIREMPLSMTLVK